MFLKTQAGHASFPRAEEENDQDGDAHDGRGQGDDVERRHGQP
jgi:hypothetical protein